jgi:hypothetical protein
MAMKSFQCVTRTGGKIFAGWAEQWRKKCPVEFYQRQRDPINKVPVNHTIKGPFTL